MTQKIASPVGAVDAANVAGTAPLHDMSILGMFLGADIIAKLVMLVLLAASFWSWVIIFDKLTAFRQIKKKTRKFEELFWSGTMLEQLFARLKTAADHPMAQIFVAAMEEWGRRDVSKPPADAQHLKIGVKERLYQAMTVARNRALETLEKRLVFLASIGSTAPFIGLFGTVWGIMHSFQSIAMTKNTTLAVVAPGIAEALFATAVGLFAAIPAVFFYNKLTTDLNDIANRLEDFSIEFGAILSRELDASGHLGTRAA